MKKEFFDKKRIIIWGTGKFARDFIYIFDFLNVAYYVTDKESEINESEHIFFVTKLKEECKKNVLVIVCEENDEVKKYLEDLGYNYSVQYIFMKSLFSLLDFDFNTISKSKKIVFWGIGEELEYFKSKNDLNADFYIDNDINKEGKIIDGKVVMHPSKISNWKELFIIITSLYYYPDIKKQLEKYGLKERIDFIFHREILYKPSVMLEKTIYDKPIKGPHCSRPFGSYAEFSYGGGLYCCCISWVDLPFGNITSLDPDTVWNSIVAKIFRLSIINKTFSFCKKGSCKILPKNFEYDPSYVSDLYNLNVTEPTNIIVSIDKSCNLKCKSCRNEFYTKISKDEKIILYQKEHIKKSHWLSKASVLVFAGMGEVFLSKVYQELLYDTENLRRNFVHILSNGILFNEKAWEKLYSRYKNIDVSISIDAATEKTYKLLRGGDWNTLLKNLQMLSKRRRENKIGKFRLSFVVQMCNYKEMELFVKIAEDLNVDEVRFQRILDSGSYSKEEFKKVSILDENGFLKNEVVEVLKNPVFNKKIVDLYTIKKYNRV